MGQLTITNYNLKKEKRKRKKRVIEGRSSLSRYVHRTLFVPPNPKLRNPHTQLKTASACFAPLFPPLSLGARVRVRVLRACLLGVQTLAAAMARYRSRSRSYSPRRRSRTPPRGRKRYDDDPRDRYRESRSYRDRRSPAPSGLLVRNLPLDARSLYECI